MILLFDVTPGGCLLIYSLQNAEEGAEWTFIMVC